MQQQTEIKNKHLVETIIDQEALSAKAKRHRLASASELREFAQILANSAPAGMTVQGLIWCYDQHRTMTGSKMTPAALHSLYRRFRKVPVVPASGTQEKPAPGRYAAVIAHRLMMALGLKGNAELVPLMPGDDDVLSKPPTREEANEFFASCANLDSWLINPAYPYREYSPEPVADGFDTEGW